MRVSATILTALPLLVSGAAAAPGFQFPFTTKPQHADAFPGRGEVIDLSKYTIGQILNYTLYHHHHDGGDGDHGHGHGHEEMARIFEEHRHTPPLVKLAWVVNRTEAIKDYLSDSDVSVTLFAPDDEALTPPHREGHSRGIVDAEADATLGSSAPIDHPLYAYAAGAHVTKGKDGDDDGDGDDDDDKDKERKRAFIKKIVTAILRYHISPSKLYLNEIQDKQTIPTSLNQTKDVGVPFRIRAAPRLDLLPPPPKWDVSLNFYARIRNGPALLAKNGIIHFINAPLLPPLTPLDQLLAFPEPFSTLTSAVQQTELDSALAPWLHHHEHEKASSADTLSGDGSDEPSSIALAVLEELVQEAKAASGLPNSDDFKAFPFTIFAPSNRAFRQIPFRIRTFLFSPFGKQYLKKLLQFHVVPQQIFHTDYHLNATRDTKEAAALSSETVKLPAFFDHEETFHPTSLGSIPHFPFHPPGKKPGRPDRGHSKAEVTRHVLPTLLGSAKNESLAVNVYEYRIGFGKGPLVRRLAVGHVGQDEHDFSKVWISDGVAWGGAVHVIGSLIRPPFAGHDHDHDHDHHDSMLSMDEHEYFKTLWA